MAAYEKESQTVLRWKLDRFMSSNLGNRGATCKATAMKFSRLAAILVVLLNSFSDFDGFEIFFCSIFEISLQSCNWLKTRGYGDVLERDGLDFIELFAGSHRIHQAALDYGIASTAFDVLQQQVIVIKCMHC